MADDLKDSRRRLLNRLDETPTASDDLADELDVEPVTIRTYVKDLRQAGYTIETTPDGYRLHDSEAASDATADDDPDDSDDDPLPTVRGDSGQPSADDLPDAFVAALRDNGLTYSQMERRYGFSRDKAQRLLDNMAEAGWAIDFDTIDKQGTRRYYIPDERDKRYQIGDGDGVYRFGLISDTHLGSTACHLSDLHDFYDRMADRGVEIILHGGDISDGWEVHQNQINEVHADATGWNRLEDYCVDNYPQRDGIETLFISGNHDRKLWRRTGVRFGQRLANRRDDLTWLGDSMARLVFDPVNNIDLELIHPSGGQPYTLGYRAQTLYREQPTDIRPSMSGIAHLHGRLYAAAEGVEAWYTACWKDLTTYGRRKGHAAEIGGWDVELTIADGEIDELTMTFVKYDSDDAESTAELTDVSEIISSDASAAADDSMSMFGD